MVMTSPLYGIVTAVVIMQEKDSVCISTDSVWHSVTTSEN